MAAAAALSVAACWPVTTRYGVNYRWSSRTIPLYEKAINFVSRDIQARRLAREVTAGIDRPRDRALRVFTWVGENVRPVPAGFPVVDDHIWHVIVRGYGAPDQRTEAYTLLAAYAGVRAATAALVAMTDGRPHGLMVAVSEFDDRRWIFDVDHQILFRRDDGSLASVDDLIANPAIVSAAGRGLEVAGIPYARYFEHLHDLTVSFDRIDRQRPLPRLRRELAERLRL